MVRTRISSNSVAWSTLTNSVSKVVSSSFLSPSFLSCAVWNLAYSITLVRILEGTLGRGMAESVPVSVLERRYGGWDGQSAWCENGFDHQRDGGTEDGAEGRPADGRTLDHVLDGLRFAVVGLRVGGWVGKEVSGHVVGVPDAVSVETINACG